SRRARRARPPFSSSSASRRTTPRPTRTSILRPRTTSTTDRRRRPSLSGNTPRRSRPHASRPTPPSARPSPAPDAMPSLQLENSIVDDRYEIRRRLNHGSYAEIYEAFDLERSRRPVIIKALNTALQGTPARDLERTLVENF